MNPGMAVMTSIFHILLFVCPVFLLAHNILIDASWGVQPPSLPEGVTDILTIVIMGFGVFFLFRRLFLARVRAISSVSDYLLFFVVFAPFVTGFIAYHQFFSYKTVLILHILTGELMLVCIPFTKLVHMVYFFLNRIFLKSEYSFGRGKRIWKEVEAQI
jgi:nitrate reductase gamma subunit